MAQVVWIVKKYNYICSAHSTLCEHPSLMTFVVSCPCHRFLADPLYTMHQLSISIAFISLGGGAEADFQNYFKI